MHSGALCTYPGDSLHKSLKVLLLMNLSVYDSDPSKGENMPMLSLTAASGSNETTMNIFLMD